MRRQSCRQIEAARIVTLGAGDMRARREHGFDRAFTELARLLAGLIDWRRPPLPQIASLLDRRADQGGALLMLGRPSLLDLGPTKVAPLLMLGRS